MRYVAVSLVLMLCCASQGQNTTTAANVSAVAAEIRTEAIRPNDDPAGHALPLASHWNCGQLAGGFTPDYQLQLLAEGHHILPWFAMPNPKESVTPEHLAYYQRAIRRAAALKLPICFVGTQWEHYLSEPPYLNLPADQNPNVIAADGKPRPMLSPMGPVDPWRKVGPRWMISPLLERLEALYPDPPMVMFVSNNEQPKLTWNHAANDERFVKKYGRNRDNVFKRKVFANAWIERYGALITSMRGALTNPTWRTNSRFVGYDAFGSSCLGRWSKWSDYSLYTPRSVSPWPDVWDGGSPSYYQHNWSAITDFTVYSPQVESMNWVFMLKDALRQNPNFWFELSTWDGYAVGAKDDKRKQYAALGQTFTPERYGGYVQFGLWLLRPRSVREFRGWNEKRADEGPYFEPILRAVDRVYSNDILKRFWRKGTLVPNRAHQHPYEEDVPTEYAKRDRWFMLDTTLDPPRPWKLDTKLPVFSIAYVLGKAPDRQWLVYAHSPLENRRNVGITIPGFGEIKVDVPVTGAFYHVFEYDRQCTRI